MRAHLKKFDTTGPNAKFFAALNKIVEEVNRMAVMTDFGMLTETTTNGTRIREKDLGGGPSFVTLGGCDQLGRPITIKVAAKGPPTLV